VERYLKQSGMTATRFGRRAARDPRLVLDMRGGRAPRRPLTSRLVAFLDTREAELGQ
jgi:hypothetical protein